jgi:uncharacterized protein (TIGR00299 family) protein
MTVGALLALGVPLDHLREELGKLEVTGYRLRASAVEVHGITATKFDVDLDAAAPPAAAAQARDHDHDHGAHDHHHDHHHDAAAASPPAAHAQRRYRDIRAMLEASDLAAGARQRALAIFARLAAAEGAVHGVPVDDVTFHEVGAVDSIVDITGAAIGLEWLGVEHVFVSPLPLGSGLVRSQHGVIPVPAPATVELLRDFPVRVDDGTGELVTPTGAAIIAALAQPGEPLPPLRVEAVGYGAGTRRQLDRPNLLRLLLGHSGTPVQQDELVEIAATIDDANPELYAHALEAVLEAGARDAWLVNAQMKKQRPGVVLHALVEAAARDALRFHTVQRLVLPRQQVSVETPYGSVQVKLAQAPDGTLNIAPEHDDCRRLARQRGVALKLVYQAAIAGALARR